MGDGVGVDDGIGVLVAAAAVWAADVAASSSGDGPQADNKIQNSIKVNPRLNVFVRYIISLLLLLSGFNETSNISINRYGGFKKQCQKPMALFSEVKQ
jgi:hypothetical protein